MAQQTVDPLQYCAAVAQAMGVPATPYTIAALKSLADGEGQWGAGGSWNYTADFNPFNISGGQSALTEYAKEPNGGVRSTQNPGNGPPVDEFTDWQTGIQATADFIKNADPGIYQALQAIGTNPSPENVQQFFSAAGTSGSFGASAAGRSSFFQGNLQAAQGQGVSLASYTPGTQTDVPGTPGAATPAGTPAPADVTAGTTSSITGTGGSIPTLATGAKWPEVKAYIQKYYPTYSWLLNIKGPDSPESVIKEAVTEGLDSTRIQALVDQTPWWKDTSTALKQFQQNKATNPGDLDFNVEGSSAQQKLGDITLAAKNAGYNIPKGLAQNLATEALMYNWDTAQVQENIASVINTGAGQVFSPAYEQGVAQNSRLYNIGGKEGTGATAATAITTVRNAIAGQGYNAHDFTTEDVDNLAEEYMKFGWSPQQLAAAVIKVGAGGTAYQLSPSYTQGLVSTPQQYSFGNTKTGEKPGTIAQQALTTVRDAIAAAGKTIGGKGGISNADVQNLAQESMMFGWSAGQLAENINSLGKGGGLLSSQYLEGLITNSQEYQPGGNAYNQAQTAVQQALANAGKTNLPKTTVDALIAADLEQGWDPGQLTLAIGRTKGAGALSPAYLTGMQTNSQQYEKGGYVYNQAQAAIRATAAGSGKVIKPSDMQALIQQYMQQGWSEGSAQLVQAIGTAAGSGGYTQAYLTGVQGSPQQYEPGGAAYIQANNDVLAALRLQNVAPGNLTQADMNTLLQGVMQQGWDQNTLADEIGALHHTGTPYNPQYLTGIAQTPWEYKDFSTPGTTAQQVLTQVEMVAANQGGGVNLTVSQAHDLAQQAMQYGGNNPPDSLIQSLLQKYVSVAPQQPAQQPQQPISANAATSPAGQGAPMAPTTQQPTGLNVKTNAPATVEQLRTQAANYFANPSDGVLQQWAQQIAGGTQTIQQFEAAMAQQAAEKYPGMAQLIQQGQTPSQIAGNLQTLASQTLEINPDQVNFTDNPTYQKMLDGGYDEGPDGTKQTNGQMMTYTQAGDYLRGLPQYATTTNAKSQAADVETAILSAWGRVA